MLKILFNQFWKKKKRCCRASERERSVRANVRLTKDRKVKISCTHQYEDFSTTIDLNQTRRWINFSFSFSFSEKKFTEPSEHFRFERRKRLVFILTDHVPLHFRSSISRQKERLFIPTSVSMLMITRSRRSTWLSSGWSIDSTRMRTRMRIRESWFLSFFFSRSLVLFFSSLC